MIISNYDSANFYLKRFPQLENVFDFIRGIENLKVGKYDIKDGIFVNISDDNPKPLIERKLEAHRKYVDLQYVIFGIDELEFKNLSLCQNLYADYDEKTDMIYFNDKSDYIVKLRQKDFALIFPQEAHSSLSGKIRKAIFKIPVELF